MVTTWGPRKSLIGVGSYSLRDAALLLGIPYAKLRRWAAGYWYSAADADRFSAALVPGQSDEIEDRILSFQELMEFAVIRFYRSEGVSMTVVRAARAKAQELFRTEFPFATRRLQTNGVGIFADLSDIEGVPHERLHLELSRSQVTHDEFVEPFFRKLDFDDDGQASAYWPLGRDKSVLLYATRSFGQPIIQRNGTPTFVLFQMREGGESVARIASWYGLSHDEVEAALEYEGQLRNAA